MVRHKLLLGIVGALVATLAHPAAALATVRVPTSACSIDEGLVGGCAQSGGAIGNGGVDVSAGWDSSSPGRGGGGNSGGDGGDGYGGGGNGGGGGTGLPDGVSLVPGGVPVDSGDAASGPFLPPRRGAVVVPPDPAAPACVPQTPCDPALVVRVADLVNIRAEAPGHAMEPDGWTVVGIPTNFFATASTHIQSGPLLGASADVRFTPVGFRWDYGDGTSRRSVTGGASWAALQLAEFSETATSHVFERVGSPTIGLVVSYSAEYSFAGAGWRPVQGLLDVPAEPIPAIAERAGTVLVAESCSANPGGPGC
jgi:hypothetical protein